MMRHPDDYDAPDYTQGTRGILIGVAIGTGMWGFFYMLAVSIARAYGAAL
jgi:hypothetical protein